MKDVLVLCPQRRDFDAIRAADLERRYNVAYAGYDLDALPFFEPEPFLAECERIPAEAVVATKDRSALVAAVLAARRGLTGPPAEAIVRCQHKPTSRELQREAAPEATPRCVVLDGTAPPFPPPFFVKPAVGRLSQGARRVDELSQLPEPEGADPYAAGWARLAELAGPLPGLVGGVVAEELVTGDEVTLEGYVHRGRVTVVGVTDSVKYEGTNSFERFEYPSRLPPERTAELGDLAARIVRAHEFDDGFFNVEFAVPERGQPWILELNGRIASQFAPLVSAVHGRSTYDALFALACGDDPAWDSSPPDGVAVSYVVRVFDDALVTAVPEPEQDVEILVKPGLRLSEQGANDAQSFRLAIVYGAGETREEAVERSRARARALPFVLEA